MQPATAPGGLQPKLLLDVEAANLAQNAVHFQVLLNVLGKDFGELLGPLYWHEAAPPLFLWLERALFLAAGDGVCSSFSFSVRFASACAFRLPCERA